jgi:hypothetical protein
MPLNCRASSAKAFTNTKAVVPSRHARLNSMVPRHAFEALAIVGGDTSGGLNVEALDLGAQPAHHEGVHVRWPTVDAHDAPATARTGRSNSARRRSGEGNQNRGGDSRNVDGARILYPQAGGLPSRRVNRPRWFIGTPQARLRLPPPASGPSPSMAAGASAIEP